MQINNCPKCDSGNFEISNTIEFFDIIHIKIKCDNCLHEISGINRQKLINEWNKKMYKCPECKSILDKKMFCSTCCSKWIKSEPVKEDQEKTLDNFLEGFINFIDGLGGKKEKIEEAEIEESHNNGGDTDYYKIPTGAEYCQDIIESREMNFSQGNILKAAFCFNIERGASDYKRDLNKIIWFANRELDRIR